MRISELIHLVVFAYLAALGLERNRPQGVGKAVAARAFGVWLLLLTLPRVAEPGSLAVSVTRDWLPAPLMLLTYWTAGLLAVGSNAPLASVLLTLDRRLLAGRGFRAERVPPPLGGLLELAYLLCYVLVPMGLGCLYFLRLGRYADDYWAVVLPPTYICYAAIPFFRTRPPRHLSDDPVGEPRRSWVRRLNLWILDKGSIAFNTFPSAHVAASGAAALAVLHQAPALGAFFLAGATGIALGSVYGRYHYAADAVAGAGLALLGYLGWLVFR